MPRRRRAGPLPAGAPRIRPEGRDLGTLDFGPQAPALPHLRDPAAVARLLEALRAAEETPRP